MAVRTRGRLVARATAAALLAAAGGGCVVRAPAGSQRLRASRAELDEQWPARWAEPLTLRIAGPDHPHDLRAVAHTEGGTLFEIVPRPSFSGESPTVTDIVDERGRLVTRGTGDVLPLGPRRHYYLFASYPMTPLHVELLDGTAMTVDARAMRPMISFLAVDEPEDSPRGIALLLNSISGYTIGERTLRDELCGRGWLVVQVTPSVDSLQRLTLDADDEEGLDEVADHVARRIDDWLAERAYAAEAILAHLRGARPELARRPVVTVGCSAGAVNLPTVAARLPGTFAAAVIIGGGSNLARIAARSDLLRSRLRIRVDGHDASGGQLESIIDTALLRSSLDPYHTAVHLHGIPVLMLHARFDRIVPSASGDALYERLHRPERWSYSLGHLGLFAWLTMEADEIADWIDRVLAGGPYTEPGAAPATAPGGTP